MDLKLFSLAAVFAFLFFAGCTQTTNEQTKTDISAGINLTGQAIGCKTICESTGGQFTPSPPGRIGVTFAWCMPYTENSTSNYGCICNEPAAFDQKLGCVNPVVSSMRNLCERTNGTFVSAPCPPCQCGNDPFCQCEPCMPPSCDCPNGMEFNGMRGCINASPLPAQNASNATAPINASADTLRIWYFAFGSNLNFRGMQSRVGYWPEVRKATLPDYMRTFAGAADIRPNASSVVYGAIYLLNESQMQALDRYEGVSSGSYRRINVTVIAFANGSNETLPAVAYQYVQQKPFSPPSQGYIDTITQGLLDNGYGDYEIGLLLREARINQTG